MNYRKLAYSGSLLKLIFSCFFDAQYINVHLHLDRKSKFSPEEIQFLKEPQVKLITNRYIVNWGGFNHLKSYLYLSKEALKNEDEFCFHLITGQDFPVKPISYFQSFGIAQMKEQRDYLAHHEVPFKRWRSK